MKYILIASLVVQPFLHSTKPIIHQGIDVKPVEVSVSDFKPFVEAKLPKPLYVTQKPKTQHTGRVGGSRASVEEVKSAIRKYAAKYGVSADRLLRIGMCESGYNNLARNRNYSAGSAGNPVGVFQHIEGYWPARAVKYGRGGAHWSDYDAQAEVTAGMFRDGGAGAWECKGY